MRLQNRDTGEIVERNFYKAYSDIVLSDGPLLIGYYTWELEARIAGLENPKVSPDIGAYYPEFLWGEVSNE